MKLPQCFLNVCLFFLAINANAQDFKVIEETKDYILKEVDSAYYYSHGLPPKDDFIIDTTKIKKVNGVLKLPLDNGKEVVFTNNLDNPDIDYQQYMYLGYDKDIKYFLVIQKLVNIRHLLVNQKNGIIDTSLFDSFIFSPSKLFYAYFSAEYITSYFELVFFKNINTGNVIKIKLNNEAYDQILWKDDFSFMFYSKFYDRIIKEWIIKKYYLLQIKQ